MILITLITFLTHAQRGDFCLDDLDEHKRITLLTDMIEKIKKDNKELNMKQALIQVTKGPQAEWLQHCPAGYPFLLPCVLSD